MKILVDREDIQKTVDYLIGDGCWDLHSALDILQTMLINNPEPIRGECKVCGAKTNSHDSGIDINYCPKCWNKRLAKKDSSTLKEGTSMFVSTLTDTSRVRKTLLDQYRGKD